MQSKPKPHCQFTVNLEYDEAVAVDQYCHDQRIRKGDLVRLAVRRLKELDPYRKRHSDSAADTSK